MLQLFDSIRKRKARIAVMIVAHLSAVFWEGLRLPQWQRQRRPARKSIHRIE